KWQDIFVAVGAKHPTHADARRFAESLAQRARAGEDFARLAKQFDEGTSAFNDGLGYGQRRGEIKPPEVEPHLFALKDGQIGPVVEISTGYHIIRLVKREYAGQLPLNDKVQTQIRTRLRNEMANRMYKHLLKELRERVKDDIQIFHDAAATAP